MIIINTLSDDYFTLNGREYARIYQPLSQGCSVIGIYNAYDTKQQLVPSTGYCEYLIDGVEYDNSKDAMAAILRITWSYSSGSGSTDSEVLGTLGHTPVNGSYLAFGGMVKIDDNTVHHYVRIGTDHVGSVAGVYRVVYNVNRDEWSNETLVFEESGYDPRNMLTGVIGTDIFLFFTRYNPSSGTFKDAGYIQSTDNGNTWSAYQVLYTTISGGYFCGGGFAEMCKTSNPSTFLMSAYWYDTTHNLSKWGYFKTTNSGNTWSEVIVNTTSFSSYEAEPSFAYIGSSRIVCVVRKKTGGFDLWRSYNDGGTWSKLGALPFCVSNVDAVGSIYYDYNTNKLVGQFVDRSVNKFYTVVGDADECFYNLQGFKDIRITDRGADDDKNGYASFVSLETAGGVNKNTLLCAYSRQFSVTSAKLYQVKIKLP